MCLVSDINRHTVYQCGQIDIKADLPPTHQFSHLTIAINEPHITVQELLSSCVEGRRAKNIMSKRKTITKWRVPKIRISSQ